MNKIIVIGCPGAGKSHVSRLIGSKLDIPVYHVDRLYWKENWEHKTHDELKKEFDKINLDSKWIIDGYYPNTLEYRMNICDTIILLDIDPEVCVLQEEMRRNKKRADFPEFLHEGEDPNFVVYIRNFNNDQMPLIKELLDKYQDKKLIVLHNKLEEEEFINSL